MTEKSMRFLTELARRFRADGIHVGEINEEGLPLFSLDGTTQAGHIAPSGGYVNVFDKALMSCIEPIAREVSEYMDYWEVGRPLAATGLDAATGYRVLGECGDVVLAAKITKHGVEFTTWEWVQNRTSLWAGHYTCDYKAAKRDFAIRCNLVDKEQIFLPAQCTAMLAAITAATDEGYQYTYPELLESTVEQLKRALPEQPDRG